MKKNYIEEMNLLKERLISKKITRKRILNSFYFLLLLFLGNSLYAQTYCVPSNTYSSSYYISSVKTTGALQDLNRTSGFSPNGYGDYSATDTLIVYAGQTITFQATHPSSTYSYDMWVDWDKDGSFTGTNEKVLTTNGSGVSSPVSATLTIPTTAPLGITRVRIRNAYLSMPAPACGNHDYGEAEDYIIKVIALSPCAGQPSAGTVDPSFTICANTTFTIKTTGVTMEDGISGIWQSSPTGANTWTDMALATGSSYSVGGGIISGMDYRYIATCANSSMSDTSSILSVTMKAANECYCTPTYSTGCSDGDEIENVTLNGETINLNNSSVCSGGYSDFTALTAPDLAPGGTYSVNVTNTSFYSSSEEVRIWIDYNSNGSFEPSEEIANTNGNGILSNVFTASFTVPPSTLAGNYRMRVRMVYYGGPSIDPCTSESYGETEDYTINIIQLTNCVGVPDAGTVTSPISICGGTDFTLSTSNSTEPADGLIGQWQSSPAGTNTWTDISGALSPTYNVVGGALANTDYRFILTCTHDNNNADTTAVISVTLKTASECYCTPSNTYSTSYYISSVKTTGALQDVYRTSTFSPNGYGDYTATDTLIVYPGQTITFEATHPSSTYAYNVWVDWNLDGSFTGPNENILSTGTNYMASPVTQSITFPLSTPAVTTRIRVRNDYIDSPVLPCGSQDYGEAEDYIIKVIQLDPCVGQPNAGIVNAGDAICANTAMTIKTTGSTIDDGITGIWQSSPGGANTWADITGATASTYTIGAGVSTDMDYRYIVTCANSSLSDTSSVISYTIKPANQCYCTPSGNSSSYVINNFSTTGGVQNISNLNSGYSTTGYGDFTATDTVSQARTQPITFSSSYTGGTFGTKIWVDWNQDGQFDATEIAYQTSSYASSETSVITVPATAVLGTTRMRIGISYTPSTGPANACVTGLSGEYEDYIFEVLPFNGCTGQPTAGTITTPLDVCAGVAFTLTSTGASLPAANLNGIWQSSPAGANTWTNVTGATTSSYNLSAGVTVPTDFRFILNCTNSSLADTSNVLSVTLKPANQCYCTPTGANSSYYVDNFATTGGVQNVSNMSSGYSTGGYGDFTATQTVSQARTQPVNFSGANVGTTFGTKIWVDWNQDGLFDATEIVYQSTSYSATSAGSFTVPATAALGTTRMRIGIASTPSSGPANACVQGIYGEYEDYTFEVLPFNGCTGQPTAGTITTPLDVCSGVAFTLTSTGASLPAANLDGIWQSSPAGANTWTDVTGATTSSYNLSAGVTVPTDFRFILNCTNSSLADTSNVLSVTLKPANQCYCIPSGSNTSYYIKDFSTTGGVLNINNTASGYSTGGYGDFTATDTVSQMRTNVVNLSSSYSSSSTYGTKIWVDWNQDGQFDATEIMYQSTSYASNATASFTVPNSALLGSTRMRIGISYTPSTGPANACLTSLSGEYEDYTFVVLPLPECTGQPTAGIVTSPMDVCSGIDFTLSTLGSTTPGNNLNGSWQSSADGLTGWTDVTGATDSSYTVVGGVTSPIFYRYVLTCTNSSLTDTSAVITVTIKPANQCYCTPTGASASYYVKNFATTGGIVNISNLNSGYSTGGYGDFTATDTVSQVRTNVVNVSGAYTGTTFGTKIWVDWNQDGQFDATEVVYQSSTYSATLSASFTVPNSAALGFTRMRIGIASSPTTGPANACALGIFGEYEDYTFNVLPLGECTGQPTAGTITSPMAICSGVDFAITTLGSTTPANNLNGIWQSSPDGATAWTDMVGATDSSYTVVGGVTSPAFYRYILTCANSSLSDTSAVISVTLKPANQCYCTPAGTSASYYINDFSTTGGAQNVTNLGSGHSTTGYGDFTATDTISQAQTQTVNFSSAYGSGSYTFGTKIWIDWNQDGQFDASEIVYTTSSYTSSESGVITVPTTATLGATRLRIGISYTPNSGPADPCMTNLSGEFEDYTFVVLPFDECAGQPSAGTTGSPITICSGTAFTVTTTGASSPANNLSGVWQSSPAGANTWTNIPAATGFNYTVPSGVLAATDYRYVMTCGNNSLSDTSNVLSVTLKPATECYCTPSYTNGCSDGDVIENVTLNGESINLNNSSTCGTGSYTDYTTITAPDLVAGNTYTVSVANSQLEAEDDDVRIWIDFNQNGTFENSEAIANTNGQGMTNNVVNANFVVPTGLALGTYRMRVRLVYNGGSYIDPCVNAGYGETEDYLVSIVSPCVNPVVYLGADKQFCSGTSVTLDAGNPGLTYLWNDASTNKTLTVTTAGTYYVKVMDGSCFATDTIQVSLYPSPSADSIVATNNGNCQFSLSLSNEQNVTGYQWTFGDGTPGANTATPSHSFTADGQYNVSVIISNNCNQNTTITKVVTCSTVGVKDVSADGSNFRLYPNPTSSDVTIEVAGSVTMESITIVDNVGKVVYIGTPTNTKKYSVDVTKLSNGLYTALIRTNQGLATKKFEVSK